MTSAEAGAHAEGGGGDHLHAPQILESRAFQAKLAFSSRSFSCSRWSLPAVEPVSRSAPHGASRRPRKRPMRMRTTPPIQRRSLDMRSSRVRTTRRLSIESSTWTA